MSGHMTDKDLIIDFMKTCTVEVTPGGAAKVEDFREILRPDTTVYVTFLPGSDFADTVKTVRRLRDEGMNPVPHFAARSIPSKAFLEDNLKMLQGEVGVEEALLIGGGVDNPVGEFHCSMQVLETQLFEKYGIKKLGVAGHPEGSPDIPAADVSKAIREKNAYAKNTDMSMYLATQFCFEAEPILAWDKKIREEDGNELPVHIGIPGLATIKTLIKHAQACGIGASMRVLTRQAANIAKLMTVRMPDKLTHDLAVAVAKDPDCLIKQCHLYPLGGLKKSAAWLYAVQDGEFDMDAKKGGFKVNVEIG
ncbi:5,10-methylenetetrahydrofolate reductase [Aestuariispira insulae]|uniref:5,10-methylenetetrahydrofolate reductase n=2 Tax=Aestuariispira insulae TaxID=1461337 RepID=A0A3D9HS00_9PROT|nr:5,10-methylenetetrahydrofolate reductase [Aestuariispira insulae]